MLTTGIIASFELLEIYGSSGIGRNLLITTYRLQIMFRADNLGLLNPPL
jgi:hypothetical protein